MNYEFINLDNVRVDVRSQLEREHAEADFAVLAEPDASKLPELLAARDRVAAKIENIKKSVHDREQEIEAALAPPPPEPEPEPEPKKTLLQRLRWQ